MHPWPCLCLWRRNPLDFAPLLQKILMASRVAGFRHDPRNDAVGAKTPERLPQFTPRHDHAHPVEEPQREGPDRSPRFGVSAVAVADLDLGLRADRLTDHRQFRTAALSRLRSSDEERRCIGTVPDI